MISQLKVRRALYFGSGLALVIQAVWVSVSESTDIVTGLGGIFITGERQVAILMAVAGIYVVFSSIFYQRYAKLALLFAFGSWSLGALAILYFQLVVPEVFAGPVLVGQFVVGLFGAVVAAWDYFIQRARGERF